MSDFLNADALAARTERAANLAAAAGRELGLTVDEPVILHDVFSVVVHLTPSPVVVRIPVALPSHLRSDLALQRKRQQTELDVVGWLADREVPVVAPSPLVPREPVGRDGHSMTFWRFVSQDDSEPDYVHNAAATATLHAALREYPGELEFMSVLAMIPQCLGELDSRPDLIEAPDLTRAVREWQILAPVLSTRAGFAARFPGVTLQPIHGDSPPYNMISTPDGELFSDFEDATLGPAEWDLTFVGATGEEAYNTVAAERGMRTLDDGLMRVMETARMLQLVACLALVPQLPMLADGLKSSLDTWRALPLGGGLAA